ncbi:2-C-methyl-D-erythritol 4-phosphate cytidylyltransferase [Brevibacterium sp. CS2]|uniref:IspD/TarI family cytidylyltransferase n=1 Tax=Brevibacterium sp. CS2 TaxID=2575923 RepID=UPI0020C74F2B|nr:2-C-methyl-D-erythritol 4-phosphate cytidylyltransferase [Brevibacterium sp. CS2]
MPAAGSGTRLGSDRPKAFVALAGRTLLEHCVLGTLASGAATDIVVAVPEALVRPAQDMLDALLAGDGAAPGAHGVRVRVVAGGADRIDSVARALDAAGDPELVLVHDAARCLTPPEVFVRVAAALHSGARAVVPVLPMTDTVKRAADTAPGAPAGTRERLLSDLDRGALRRVQTPQGFAASVLREAHRLQRTDPLPAATDDAQLVERLGYGVEAVAGDERALKITHPIDLRIAGLHLADGAGIRSEQDPS